VFSSSIVVALILLIAFIAYKRNMLKQIFFTDITSPANQFQEQLEHTGDIIIESLEEKIIRLQYLLEEANEKIICLDNKIQAANKVLNIEDNNVKRSLNQSLILKTIPNIAKNNTGVTTINIDNYKDMGRNDKRSSIINMADLGYNTTEIAKATGISKGEIMLLLQLHKK